ncbi:MAG: VCBS repeat-containing protein [Archangium sp.]|nr:VCBS repeat-containing protein [Archangium sp.]MDP3158073.1 VCBS repeat-containing protein [Archangium sp.]MDP3570521.1 VCBS repeat-containing protein [Archangium sp.]
MALRVLLVTFVTSVLVAGCACGPTSGEDGGLDAGGEEDASVDAGRPDAGRPDAGVDAGEPDAGEADAGELDDGGCRYRLTAVAAPWTTGRPLSLELADLNGDGHLDFIVATTSTLEVRLNDGQGAPIAPGMSGPLTPLTLVVNDVDGDGLLDVVAVDVSGTLTLLAGDGDGGLSVQARLDAGRPFFVPLETAMADLDLDGRADFVTVDVGGSVPELITVRGQFDGGAPRASRGSRRLVLADVTGDGLIDALVGNAQYGLTVHPGDGDGGFGASTVFLGSTAVNAVALADVTGDGVPDAVCSTGSYDGTTGLISGAGVSVLPGIDGGFGAPLGTPNGRDIIWALVLADMNRDGLLDAVTTRLAFDGGVDVLAVDGGAFSLLARVGSRNGWALAVGDLNEDGWPDVAVGEGAGSNGEVRVLLGSCQ